LNVDVHHRETSSGIGRGLLPAYKSSWEGLRRLVCVESLKTAWKVIWTFLIKLRIWSGVGTRVVCYTGRRGWLRAFLVSIRRILSCVGTRMLRWRLWVRENWWPARAEAGDSPDFFPL
jgi:hypothetical protein